LIDLKFDFLGNLDADVSMDTSYYENILSKFEGRKRLGIAGGIRYDLCKGRFRKVHCSKNSVGGPFQLFRRECYEEIGGYRPNKIGGIDAIAEIMARMKGWEVEHFPEFRIYHYRCTGTASGSLLKANFKKGMQHYGLGYHPLFQGASCVLNLFRYPVIIGSLAVMSGYFWAAYSRLAMAVPDEVIRYLRLEQMDRLRSFFLTGKGR